MLEQLDNATLPIFAALIVHWPPEIMLLVCAGLDERDQEPRGQSLLVGAVDTAHFPQYLRLDEQSKRESRRLEARAGS
jgi:hypothetical protein